MFAGPPTSLKDIPKKYSESRAVPQTKRKPHQAGLKISGFDGELVADLPATSASRLVIEEADFSFAHNESPMADINQRRPTASRSPGLAEVTAIVLKFLQFVLSV